MKSRLFLIVAVVFLRGSGVSAEPPLVRFQVNGHAKEGLLLVQTDHRTVLLSRDGWLHDSLDGQRPQIETRLNSTFVATTAAELRSALQVEFGRGFEVVPTQHYLVVQSEGRGHRWPRTFEGLYREFVRFMEVRGLQTRSGRFPLVAVILPDQAEFQRELERLNVQLSRVAGIYQLGSNRVYLHEQGQRDYVAETVRHESAHQVAYNVGIHSRVADTPRWIVEGVGCLFEPAAMQSFHLQRGVRDRSHRGYVTQFIANFRDPTLLATELLQLVSDDTLFQTSQSVDRAYCLSWALTFYMAERKPSAFAAMLQETNHLPPFQTYPRLQRQSDFARWIDQSLPQFAADLSRFIESLR